MYIRTSTLVNGVIAVQPESLVNRGGIDGEYTTHLLAAYWYSLRAGAAAAHYGVLSIQLPWVHTLGAADLSYPGVLDLAAKGRGTAPGRVDLNTVYRVGQPDYRVYPDRFHTHRVCKNYSAAALVAMLAKPLTLPAGTDGWYRLLPGSRA